MLAQDSHISAVVMTHPQRLTAAELLLERHPELDLRIVVDPNPNGPPSSLRTARLAWRSVEPGATHHLVIQDDAVLCGHFMPLLTAALSARSDQAVSLFTEWGSRTSHVARLAAISGAAWAEIVDDYIPSHALVLPADVARGFEEFVRATPDIEGPDDVALLEYLRSRKVAAHVYVPNLVEHADMPSLAGNDVMGPRRSVCYFPEPSIPLPRGFVKGSGAVSGMDVIPHFSWWEGRSVCCIRQAAIPPSWRKVPTSDVLTGRGIDHCMVREEFAAAIAEFDRDGTLRSRVSEILLFQLWTTAFTLGLVAADIHNDMGCTDRVEAALSRPVVKQALSTMAPGGLRRFVPDAELDRVSMMLEPVVHSAVRLGCGTPSESGTSPESMAAGIRAAPSTVSSSRIREGAIVVADVSKHFFVRDKDRSQRSRLGLRWSARCKRTALDRISLEIEVGEFLGLLGQNGAGKSTLIKVMTGLLVPDAGKVRVMGLDPHRDQVRNAWNIGVAFGQKTQLWWDLPARESFEILRDIYGISDRAYARRLAELDDVLHLSQFWHTPARFLSLGQRVRCDLAAAILHQPRVLFLDEPTIGLDVLVKDQVRSMLASIAHTGDHVVVLTTHDAADVEALCQRLIIIDCGRFVFDGPVDTFALRKTGQRSVTVHFAQPIDQPHLGTGELYSRDGATVTFLPRPGASEHDLVAELLATYEVRTINLNRLGLEQALRSLYAGAASGFTTDHSAAARSAKSGRPAE